MKGFVFDLDNTLYDRYGTIHEFMRVGYERIKPYLNPAYDLEKAFEHVCHTEAIYISDGWEGVYEHLVQEYFFNADNIPTYDKVHHFAFEGFTNIAVGFDGIHEFLDELKNRGYKLALLTNASNSTYQRSKLRLLGLERHFDVITISGDFAEVMFGDRKNSSYQKPHPAIFVYTAEQLGLEPKDLYYVGDNPRCDVMGALNSGYTPIWVRSRSPWTLENKYLPKLCVDNVKDILDII